MEHAKTQIRMQHVGPTTKSKKHDDAMDVGNVNKE